MDLKTLTLKSILLIFNALNIISAIIFIIIILFSTNDDFVKHEKVINFLTMIMSAICCSGAVMESALMLQITANIFLIKIVVTVMLAVYGESKFPLYTFFALILHGIISCLAHYMAQKLQLTEINQLISKYTGLAVIPLNPPAHVRSDVI